MPELVITTSRKPNPDIASRVEHWSRTLGATAVPRRERNIQTICREEGVRGVLIVQDDRAIYYEPAGGIEYFFHPNLAAVRIRNIKHGAPDHMVEAMDLQPGDEVLDCTMGRAADAIICAHVVGEAGRVVAIEKVPVLAHLTIEGLRAGEFVSESFTAVMRRIDARCADHNDFLPQCKAVSFDVVYFDPIFDQPLKKSQSMEDLRALSDRDDVTPGAVREAIRVARRCVVVKQRRGAGLCERLGITDIRGGKRSRVEYGVIPAE